CVPFFGRKILQWSYVLDSRIVDQNVESAEHLPCLLDHFVDRRWFRHIRRREGHAHLEVGGDFSLQIGDLVRFDKAVEDDFRAGCSQGYGNAKANSARGSRNQRHFTRKYLSGRDVFRFDGNVHGVRSCSDGCCSSPWHQFAGGKPCTANAYWLLN